MLHQERNQNQTKDRSLEGRPTDDTYSDAEKVEAEGLRNVEVVKRNALDTGLEAASIDRILLFGVLPFPTLPLNRLLPEMHRVLKPEGTLAVWLFPPWVHFWIPKSIIKSGLFAYISKRNGVYNYRRH